MQDGVHYHFTTKETFEKEIAEGQFLEYAYVHSNIYGTSIDAVKAVATAGKCCILDIDVQGARQVRASDLRAIFVFVSPPSLEELERRLRGRGTESEEQITTRLKNARDELATLEEPGLYDHVIINNDLENGVKELRSIADRALAGESGPPPLTQPGSAATSRGDPPSATASLRGWLQSGEIDSPDAFSPASSLGGHAATAAATYFSPSSLVGGPTGGVHDGFLRWKGRIALVTGASGPIGRAVTLAMASSGVKVVAVSRKKKDLESLQETVAAMTGGNHGGGEGGASSSSASSNTTKSVPLLSMTDFLPVVCDLTKEAEVVALPRIVEKRWPNSGGIIDVLINASGTGSIKEDVSLVHGTTSAWVNVVSVDVLGTALVLREVTQSIIKRVEKGQVESNGIAGHIINIGCSDEALERESALGGGMQGIASRAVREMMDMLGEEVKRTIAVASSKGSTLTETGLPAVRVTCITADSVRGRDSPVEKDGGEEKSTAGNAGDKSEEKSVVVGSSEAARYLEVEDVVAAVAWCLGAPGHVDVSTLELKSSIRSAR